jgi:hypothetical protein
MAIMNQLIMALVENIQRHDLDPRNCTVIPTIIDEIQLTQNK